MLLSGRYLYIALQEIKAKEFFVHVDLVMQDCNKLVLSLSNTYKRLALENKKIKLPVKELGNKWAVVSLDVHEVCERLKSFPKVNISNQRPVTEIVGIKVCANVSIKGVYSSNHRYTVEDLPNQIGFLNKKHNEWRKLYDYVILPEPKDEELIDSQVQEAKPQELQISKQELRPIEPLPANSHDRYTSDLAQRIERNHNEEPRQHSEVSSVNKLPVFASRGDFGANSSDRTSMANLQHVIGFTAKNCPDVRLITNRGQTFLASSAGRVVVLSAVNLLAYRPVQPNATCFS